MGTLHGFDLLAWLFVKMFSPLMTFTSCLDDTGPWSCRIILELVEYFVCWIVAPSRESICFGFQTKGSLVNR